MIHNVTEGLGIAAPYRAPVAPARAVVRLWLTLARHRRLCPPSSPRGSAAYITNEILAVLFFGSGPSGAALQVVFEVGRYLRRHAPGGLASGTRRGGRLPGRPRRDVGDGPAGGVAVVRSPS